MYNIDDSLNRHQIMKKLGKKKHTFTKLSLPLSLNVSNNYHRNLSVQPIKYSSNVGSARLKNDPVSLP